MTNVATLLPRVCCCCGDTLKPVDASVPAPFVGRCQRCLAFYIALKSRALDKGIIYSDHLIWIEVKINRALERLPPHIRQEVREDIDVKTRDFWARMRRQQFVVAARNDKDDSS